MENFINLFNQYARSELLILVPVLSVLGRIFVSHGIAPRNSTLILTGVSILLCGLYTFATAPIQNVSNLLLALFTSITQGILYSGASVLGEVVLNPNCIVSMLTGKPCTTEEAIEETPLPDTEQFVAAVVNPVATPASPQPHESPEPPEPAPKG